MGKDSESEIKRERKKGISRKRQIQKCSYTEKALRDRKRQRNMVNYRERQRKRVRKRDTETEIG